MIEIPTLTTERLTLRAFRPDDFEAYAVMMADPEVTRYLGGGKPLPRGDAWSVVRGPWSMVHGPWVRRLK